MLNETAERHYLERIVNGLKAAGAVIAEVRAGSFHIQDNGGRDVVTEVDRRVSGVLRRELVRAGEGWLSEEDVDDLSRLDRDVVWVVDPLDGTREFVDGIPEWAFRSGS